MEALFFWFSVRYAISMKVIDKYYGDGDDYFVIETEDKGRAVRVLTSTDTSSAQGGIYLDDNSTYGEWGFPRLAYEATVAARPQSVLLLGGGPMRLATDLRQALDGVTILTVEQEQSVIAAANQWFGFDQDAYTKSGSMIYIGDAEEAVIGILRSKGVVPGWSPYGVVIVDLFNGSRWPEFMLDAPFWVNLEQLVEGPVLVNHNHLSGQSLPVGIENLFDVEEVQKENGQGSSMYVLTKRKRSE